MKKFLKLNKVFLGLFLAFSLSCLMPCVAEASMAEKCSLFTDAVLTYSESCWTCDIFILFFDAGNSMAGQVNTLLSGPAIDAMVMFLALWLVFNTAIFFSSIAEAPDINAHLTKVGGMCVKSGIAGIFLTGGATFAFDTFINPVLITTATLGVDILSSVNSSINCSISGGASGTTDAPMSSDVRDALECFILAIASGMAKSQAIAQGMCCGAVFWLKVPSTFITPEFYIQNPLMFILGAAMGCLFAIISFIFPLTMIDVIFRICLFVGMLPMFIVAWVFPMTTSFAKKGWDLFFQSAMVFTIASLIVSMVVKMIEQAWGFTTEAASSRAGDFADAMDMFLDSSYVDAFNKIFATAFGDLFVVFFISFWGLKISQKTDKLSSQFFEGNFPDSCGIRAIELIVDVIFEIIFLVIAIITLGATTFMNVARFCARLAKMAKKVEEFRKVANKLKKFKKKMEKIKKNVEKVKKKVDKAKKLAKA